MTLGQDRGFSAGGLFGWRTFRLEDFSRRGSCSKEETSSHSPFLSPDIV